MRCTAVRSSPYQTPVTFTVNSVRSIQSERAQPDPNASATTKITLAMVFIGPLLGSKPFAWLSGFAG